MMAATKTDLSSLAARLREEFDFSEFSAADAVEVAEQGDLDSLVAAGLLCQQAGLFGDCSYANIIAQDSDGSDGGP